MAKEEIRDFHGRILGYRDDQGSRVMATDFHGRILGYYEKGRNATCDFYGRMLCTGDATAGLILFQNK